MGKNTQAGRTWRSGLVEVGAFVALIVLAFAVAVPLANRSVAKSPSRRAEEQK